MKTHAVLIIGARSEMALAIAHAFAAAGHPIQMAARDAVSLVPERDDIALRHAVDVTLHDLTATLEQGGRVAVAGNWTVVVGNARTHLVVQ